MSLPVILVVGIKVPTEKFRDYTKLEDELIGLQLKVTEEHPTPQSPKFILTCDDVEEFSLFLAWKVQELKEGMFDPTEMMRLRDPALVSIPPQYYQIIQKLTPNQNSLRYGLWSTYQRTKGDPQVWVL